MDVRVFLGRISYEKAQARELAAKIDAAYAGLLPRGLRYDKVSVQSSGGDYMADILERVEVLREQQKRLIAKAAADEKLAYEIIGRLQETDAREALVLTMYYLRDGRDTFGDIAGELHYSEEWIRKIHHSGVLHAQAIADSMEESRPDSTV